MRIRWRILEPDEVENRDRDGPVHYFHIHDSCWDEKRYAVLEQWSEKQNKWAEIEVVP